MVRVAVVQFRSGPDPADNRRRLLAWVKRAAADGAELVVCPEAAMREFGDFGPALAASAEPVDGPFVTALATVAARRRVTVLAGMFEALPGAPDRPYNTVVAVRPDGFAGRYRKVHLFDAAGWQESARLSPGPVDDDALLLVPCGELTVGVLTCYDLRFPELARALVDQGATALAIPAAWVAGPLKEQQWRTLLAARAIENGCWVFGAGQPGPTYAGRSAIVDPLGVETATQGDGEGCPVGSVSAERVAAVRERMPSLRHRRFRVVADPVPVP
jgi:predicted amidohydrolase